MTHPEEEIDPALYQYDEIYDQIKGEDRERSRSREKEKEREKRKGEEKPKQSKYIGRMKQMVSDRHKDHEVAY